jgi:long-chain acyl-CoA synthetase
LEKIWLKSYPAGIKSEIDVNTFSSINDIIEQSISKFGNKPAFANMGTVLSFSDVDRLSRGFSNYLLHELKLKKGDRVAIMMPNCLQYPVALFGVLRAGLIVVNINPLYTARELEIQLKDSGAKAIVIVENFASVLEAVKSKVPLETVFMTQLGDLLSFPKNHIVNFVVKHVKKMVPRWNIERTIPFQEALEKGMKHEFKSALVKHDDIAFLQYTGGTTGISKGAILTHKNIVANMLQAREWIKDSIFEGKEIIITALPMYHIFSLTANCFVYSSIGALNVLITNPRDIPGFIKELKKWKFTTITGVNTLFNALLHHPDFSTLDFSQFRLTLGGAMAVQRPVAEKWKKVTGCTLLEAYGLTETSPAACINPLNLKEYNGSIGLPIPSTHVSIRNDEGKEVPLGESGELWIQGPQVMKGYWNRPGETADVLTQDGWLKTGDIATIDQMGFLKIVDRKKDMILVSGFNVYPNEVEEVVASHPGVLEAAAIGVQNENSGEIVKVFVVKKDPGLSEADVIEHCRKNLTGYKVPKLVEFRKDLPKTNVGKILRRSLR